MYTNADMTLYNRYLNPETRLDKWKLTHIKGVFWNNRKGANMRKGGMDTADSVLVLIPLSKSGYVEPKAYTGADNTWTLKPGDKIVQGLIQLEVTHISELEKLYDHVHDITQVDKKDYGSQHMRHWEIGGR